MLIKVAHTAIWAVMATAIVCIPFEAWRGRFRVARWLTALVLTECAVLALNGDRCPLTGLAARFSADRAANFDIYLPCWLALRNQPIFGGLFAVGEVVLLWRWMKSRSAASRRSFDSDAYQSARSRSG
jgi:hypothetical protein